MQAHVSDLIIMIAHCNVGSEDISRTAPRMGDVGRGEDWWRKGVSINVAFPALERKEARSDVSARGSWQKG